MDLIIRQVRVVDDEPLVDIGIERGRIVALEPGIEAVADEEIDAGGRAAVPGFVEPHLHLEKALLHRQCDIEIRSAFDAGNALIAAPPDKEIGR